MFKRFKSPYKLDKYEFKIFLIRKGASQANFASLIECSPSQLSLVLNGQITITNEFLMRVKEGLKKKGGSIEEIRKIITKTS